MSPHAPELEHRERRPASRLDDLCAWAAWSLPLVTAVWAASGIATWHGDLALLRDLGFVSVGSEGLLSTIATQLAALAPVGGRLLRACLVSVVALAVCSRLAFSLFRDLLDRYSTSAHNPLFALVASQLWAQSPVIQGEAAGVGGAALPLALVLLGMRLGGAAVARGDARLFAMTGLALGFTAAESHAAAVVSLGCLVVRWTLEPGRPSRGAFAALAYGFVAAASLGALAHALRPTSANLWLDLGLGTPETWTDAPFAAPMDGVVDLGRRTFALWSERLGVVAAALGLVGLVFALQRPALRRAAAPWCVPLALGLVVPLAERAALARAAVLLAPLSSLAAVACLPLLVQLSARWLWSSRLPFGRPASVLSVTFALTLVLQQVDRSAPESRPVGAELWTDEALGLLPPHSVALVRSTPIAMRLLAAQLLHGDRPDVVIVPAPLLSSGSLPRRLLELEPELSPLLRQLAANGVADEYSLCHLADARPFFVDLDPSWDGRLLEHLRPEGLWLGFSPHAIGAADRAQGVERSRLALRRVARELAPGPTESATRHALAEQAAEQALMLAAVGDRRTARKLLRVAERLGHDGPLAARLEGRLAEQKRGRVAIHDLVY